MSQAGESDNFESGRMITSMLMEQGMLDTSSLARAETIAAQKGIRVDQVLPGLGFVSDEALASVYAQVLELALLDPADVPDNALQSSTFNSAFLERTRGLAFDAGGDLHLGMVDPLDDDAVRAVEFIAKRKVTRRVMTPKTFEALFLRAYPNGAVEGDLDEVLSRAHDLDETAALQQIEDQASEAPIVRLVNRLITDAIEAKASDIHIEPDGPGFRARRRVDGVLREVPVPPISAAGVISRIKILAGLDIAERRLPQDGRMSLAVRGRDVDFRVSTVPLMSGESVVLRILDRSNVVLDYEALGFDSEQIAGLEHILSSPHGILLVTGPTGSGKTTTLYTALSGLNSADKKILTIEDPIEYQLDGINQSQVNPKIGHGFATALRTFLRQDPDIMMVGEIRDLETAEIAIQASLTGHLVLSTLHTNDAIGAVARLIDLGAQDYLIASTVIGLVAQRLVRRLCPDCKQQAGDQTALLERMLKKQAKDYKGITFFEGAGCEACGGSGYQGRHVIAEVLPVGEALHPLILARASEAELNAAAREQGFRPMVEDGVAKAAEGVTSLSEVLRVTQVL